MTQPNILVADDDAHIRDVITFALENAAMTVLAATNGNEALMHFSHSKPDCVILDINMPGRDGLEVCRAIRTRSQVPILFLTARDEEIDRIVGLEMGADDYVVKPFSPRELVARVRAILRRTNAMASHEEEQADQPMLALGDLRLDSASHVANLGAPDLELTAIEMRILASLVRANGRVLTRQRILDGAWDDNIHVGDRTVDSHVRNIRAKARSLGCDDIITTVHGVGFRIGTCRIAP
jgi:two-component system OmpR family response regulator